MEVQLAPLICTAIIEESRVGTGETLRRAVHKEATLILGRNEFREILLQVFTKAEKKIGVYGLKDLQVHSRFASQGKATFELVLNTTCTRIMISNCPPDKLIVVLKALSVKMELLKQRGVLSARQKLQSDKQRIFEEISPLTAKEVNTVHANRNKSGTLNCNTTPSRKRSGIEGSDKENQMPLNAQKRKLNDMSGVDGDKNTAPASGNLSQSSLSAWQSLNIAVTLTQEQKRVIDTVARGRSVFFTGSAGTGKSFLLKKILGTLPPDHTFITASTGVAACQIGGTTLHAFAGIGSGQGSVEQCVELASRPAIAMQWRKCRHLIIDEISMVTGDYFDKLETVARVVRKTTERFGGIQLIICGDFLQLPPVERGSRTFAFQATSWSRCIDVSIELKDVWRQSDRKFIDVLQHIRYGRCPDEVSSMLQATAANRIESADIAATCLCTHNEDVDSINRAQLARLSGDIRTFDAVDSDVNAGTKLDAVCPVTRVLTLKKGAQVILTKNMDVSRGLVNGARGVVTGFEKDAPGYPVVRFMSGMCVTVRPERWSVRVSGGGQVTRRQLPLRLAWAISIHKSQGMTLDCVEISLARSFETGQAYVALSRARSLAGLRVLDFDKTCVRADASVLEFYRSMRNCL